MATKITAKFRPKQSQYAWLFVRPVWRAIHLTAGALRMASASSPSLTFSRPSAFSDLGSSCADGMVVALLAGFALSCARSKPAGAIITPSNAMIQKFWLSLFITTGLLLLQPALGPLQSPGRPAHWPAAPGPLLRRSCLSPWPPGLSSPFHRHSCATPPTRRCAHPARADGWLAGLYISVTAPRGIAARIPLCVFQQWRFPAARVPLRLPSAHAAAPTPAGACYAQEKCTPSTGPTQR